MPVPNGRELSVRIRSSAIKLLVLLGVFAITPTGAADAGSFLLRDYKTAQVLPQHGLELSADYLMMNSAVDVFKFRENEQQTIDPSLRSNSLGDLNGVRLLGNWGVLEDTMLHGEFDWVDLDVAFGNVQVKTYDLSLRQRLLNGSKGWYPSISIDAGVRANQADDINASTVDELNPLVKRIAGSNFSVRDDGSFFWFDERLPNGTVSAGSAKVGKPAPDAVVEHMYDITPYLRLSAGKEFSWVAPNIFAEVGRTFVHSRIDSTLKYYAPANILNKFVVLPADLDRAESYVKTGANLLFTTPFKVQGGVQYEYVRLFRNNNLDFVNYNHVVNANISYFLTRNIAVDLGGVYYQRQFNGIVPFFYNKYTQTTFDHRYGVVHAGLVFVLD